MKRSIRIGTRSASIVMALALITQLLGVQIAGAQSAPLSLTKAVCNVSTTATSSCTSGMTTATATTGNMLQYSIYYTNNTANSTVTISDQLQSGQTYQSCQVSAGGTCQESSTNPPTVTFTFSNVANGGTGVGVIDTQVTGTTGAIANYATGSSSGTTSACPSGFTYSGTTCSEPIAFTAADCTTGNTVSGTSCVDGTETCPASPGTDFAPTGVPSTTSAGTCTYPYTGTTSASLSAAPTECTNAHGTFVQAGAAYFCQGVPASCSQTGFTPGGGPTGTSCARPFQATGITTTQCTSAGGTVSANGSTCTVAPSCPAGSTVSGGTCSTTSGAVNSNLTNVTVTTTVTPTPTPSPTPTTSSSGGNVVVCGPVQGNNGGTLTISGVTFTTTSGTTYSGSPIVVGGNVCSNIVLNVNNQVTNINVYGNQTGSNFICVTNASNQTNCNLINSTGQNVGNLSTLPIAATPYRLDGPFKTGDGEWVS